MNTKLRKLAKLAAAGLFLVALVINVKVTLDDPFMLISEQAIATGSGTSSGTSSGTNTGGIFDKAYNAGPDHCPAYTTETKIYKRKTDGELVSIVFKNGIAANFNASDYIFQSSEGAIPIPATTLIKWGCDPTQTQWTRCTEKLNPCLDRAANE